MEKEIEKKWMDINPKKEPLTTEKLRQLLKREELSDDQAYEILYGLEVLSNLLIEFQTEQETEMKNQDDNLKQAA